MSAIRSLRRVVHIAVLAVACATALVAQPKPPSIACERSPSASADRPTADASCHVTVARQDSLQQAVLLFKIRDLPAGAPRPLVRVTTTSGTVSPDTARPDPNGGVTVVWHRVQGADEAAVAASTSTDYGPLAGVVSIVPRKIAKQAYQVRRISDGTQYGFEKTPLRKPLIVELLRDDDGRASRIDSIGACVGLRVVFHRASSGGGITPDTSLAAIEKVPEPKKTRREDAPDVLLTTEAVHAANANKAANRENGCVARGNWTLGEGVGFQDVRVTYVPTDGTTAAGQPAQFSALARALPKLVAGYGVSSDRRHFGANAAKTRVETIERTLPNGGKTSFDTTITLSPASIDTIDEARTKAVVGMAFAPVPRARFLTLFLGVGAQDPANDWYAGFSVFRLARLLGKDVPETEGMLFDLHFIVNGGRDDVLVDRAACISGGSCATHKKARYFRGVGAMATLDAGSILSDAFKKLIGG